MERKTTLPPNTLTEKNLLLPYKKPNSCYKIRRRMHTQRVNCIRNCTVSELAASWKERAAGSYPLMSYAV